FHRCIKKVTEDTDAMQFNTAIAAMMEFINVAYKEEHINRQTMRQLTIMLSPYAPHVAEEVWHRMGSSSTISFQPWPVYDPAMCVDDQVTISVQVNGKMRGTLAIAKA